MSYPGSPGGTTKRADNAFTFRKELATTIEAHYNVPRLRINYSLILCFITGRVLRLRGGMHTTGKSMPVVTASYQQRCDRLPNTDLT